MNITLIAAFSSLALGLLIYFWLATRRDISHFYSTNLICWLLIALFPVLLIFSFFPESSISGTIKGVSVGGAIGAFIFVWTYGVRQSLKANEIDRKISALSGALALGEARIEELSRGSGVDRRVAVPLPNTDIYCYELKEKKGKYIALITGDMRNVKCADVWVNSENTNMQMSRFYESSVSGVIRYCGARKNNLGRVTDDVINRELTEVIQGEFSLQPATVLVTNSGELEGTNNVKKILHVASTQGEVGYGYRPINDIGRCVTNALAKLEAREFQELNVKSVLFPLIGSGRAKGDVGETFQKLLQAAIFHFETSRNSNIQYIFFLTWLDVELSICKPILDRCEQLNFAKEHRVR
jgi:hypothetical protein